MNIFLFRRSKIKSLYKLSNNGFKQISKQILSLHNSLTKKMSYIFIDLINVILLLKSNKAYNK